MQKDAPEQICRKILFSPVCFAPLSSRECDLSSQVLVSPIAISISAKENEGVVEIGKVDLYGDVMKPRHNAVSIPVNLSKKSKEQVFQGLDARKCGGLTIQGILSI